MLVLMFAAMLNQEVAGNGAALAACRDRDAGAVALTGVTVRDEPAAAGDYRALRVTAANGASLLVYFDPVSEATARHWAACLGAQLPLLRAALDDDRVGAEWASVVFTSNAAYIPPRGRGVRPRWTVPTAADGALTAEGRNRITVVIPHEQVHHYQGRSGSAVPRWFAEGHATWVGLKISDMIDPESAAAERARLRGRIAAATGPLNLPGWGSVRPRREAIMRQLSPEDRVRMEADSTFMPEGTFTFTSADLIGDESNMPARYAAALQVFEGLEARHGAARVRAFAAEVTAGPGRVTEEAMAALVERHFGERLGDLLADRAPERSGG